MKSFEIRNRFFDYFVRNGHEKVSSSPVIPAQDPTILFANAGMNQFKDLFLGKEHRSYKRAVTIQKCVRAGGKHNDLDNVGFTKRHLTFFEMCGNFSFGDYFKKEAIRFAWEFLTQELGLPAEKLYVSVYHQDDESFKIWNEEIGVPAEKIFRLGEADNFWSMGETGPCGPCTEIMFDRGRTEGDNSIDGDITSSSERFMEVWNVVFMQFDRQADGSLKPLTQTGVDTGMGFERLCTVMQGKDSVYETDIFAPIIQLTEKLTGLVYSQQSDQHKAAFRVLADHIRSATFIIADGCLPSNEGRGYVLRKIIRRAALFERKISQKSVFAELSQAVIDEFGGIYPELKLQAALVKKTLATEIEKFAYNLERGSSILEQYFLEQDSSKLITGKQAFRLYDTFGFPFEITDALARQRGFTVDRIGFEHEMDHQRAQSGHKTEKHALDIKLSEPIVTNFVGYDHLQAQGKIKALISGNKEVTEVAEGMPCWIIPDACPFYVECGGQVNDEGTLAVNGKLAVIRDLKKFDGAIAIFAIAPTNLKLEQDIEMQVNEFARLATMKNHTATHLLQAALIQVLGPSVKQAGSVVNTDYLRFDFNFNEALTPEQIQHIEHLVNTKIWQNIPLRVEHTSLAEAQKRGVIAFFGEKYNPENVRVVQVPGFSAELCGGTHVRATGDIGSFKITESSALAAGTRRIFAVTGPKAIELMQENFNIVKKLSQEFKVKQNEVLEAVQQLREQLKDAATQTKQLKKQLYSLQFANWIQNTQTVSNTPVCVIELNGVPAEDLKELILGPLLDKQPGVYVLLTTAAHKTQYVIGASPMFVQQLNARTLAQWLNKTYAMKGGGSLDLAQGGGNALNASIKDQLLQAIQQGL